MHFFDVRALETREARIAGFEGVSRWIVQTWTARQEPPRCGGWDSPHNFVRRAAYRLIRQYMNAEGDRIVRRIVRRLKRLPATGSPARKNPFHMGLLAIAGTTSDKDFLSPSDRRLIAHQLLYAHRHKVRAELLIGFLNQIDDGSRAIFGKVINDEREPLFGHALGLPCGQGHAISRAKRAQDYGLPEAEPLPTADGQLEPASVRKADNRTRRPRRAARSREDDW